MLLSSLTDEVAAVVVTDCLLMRKNKMKRLHIHIAVNELLESTHFYSIIFNAPPSVEREDYAKWELTEPAVNFAISKRGHNSGINHLGIQVDSDTELKELAQRLEKAEITSSTLEQSSCCYARSNKHWILDPQGIAWESFRTLETIATSGETKKIDSDNKSSKCCTPLHMSDVSDKEDAACCVDNEKENSKCCDAR